MRTHLTLVFLSVATLLVIPSYIVADPGPTTSQAALVNAAKEQEKLRADIEAKQMALLEQQLNSAIKELDLLRKTNVDKQPLDAFAALLDVKRAELDLRRAAAKATDKFWAPCGPLTMPRPSSAHLDPTVRITPRRRYGAHMGSTVRRTNLRLLSVAIRRRRQKL
jgi:hypothetical protein